MTFQPLPSPFHRPLLSSEFPTMESNPSRNARHCDISVFHHGFRHAFHPPAFHPPPAPPGARGRLCRPAPLATRRASPAANCRAHCRSHRL